VVYDATGRIVYKTVLDDVTRQFGALQLTKGLYLVKIFSADGKSFVRKLIVQ
jgi:hypothetical protein